MPDNQPTPPIGGPFPNTDAKAPAPTPPPVVKAESPTPPIAPQAPAPPVPAVNKAADPVTTPELDRKLPKADRLVHFLQSHGGYERFVEINDFLKTFYPVPDGKEPPLWSNQGEMRGLKGLLRTMKEQGKIVFNGNNWERLGDNYHTDAEKLRKDYNISDVVIEARLPD
jgi:hypothetical protein